jgi:hypothetical protein
MHNRPMTTTQKSQKIAADFITLRDQGHSAAEAIDMIAKASHTDADTILVAIHYAVSIGG